MTKLVSASRVQPASGAGQRALKRLLDLLLGSVALGVLWPLFLLISLVIRLESPGQALFRQLRVGKGGALFTCYKFRTMRRDADQTVHQLAFRRYATGHTMSDDPEIPYKLANDKRITRVGALLRYTSADELPQLLNVLRGEMSLVGPRPAIPYELENYTDWHHERHLVKPGITGLWQVYGRGRMSFDEMTALDVRYAHTWTVSLDIKLIILTVPALLMRRGAR